MFRRRSRLSQLSVSQLVDAYQQETDESKIREIVEAILQANEGMIIHLAQAHAGKLSSQLILMERDDFITEAVIAVMDALRRYDPKKSTKFSSYLYMTLQHTLTTAADKAAGVRVKDSAKIAFRRYHQGGYDAYPELKRRFEQKQGWILPDGRLNTEAVSRSYQRYIAVVEAPLRLQSTTPEYGDFLRGKTMEQVADPKSEEQQAQIHRRLDIQRVVESFTPRQKQIAELLQRGMTYQEIAECLSLTPHIVRHEKRAIYMALAQCM